MISFFRKIRLSFFQADTITRYLAYAIKDAQALLEFFEEMLLILDQEMENSSSS